MNKLLPRGIRNNNPGNLEWGDPWQGLVPPSQRTDKRFCQFESPALGIRALARTLITYYDKRKARDGSRIDTVREIIERWAPAFENNVDAYTAQVGKALCSDCERPGDIVVDMHDYEQLRIVVEAIIKHENGPGPLRTANGWYDAGTIKEALRLAGVRQAVAVTAKLPVTKETVGATAAGAAGAAQLAEALPAVSAALANSEDHLSSGSVVRIIIGVATIAIAIFIAYSQVKKHQAGAL
ncbi:hypothetical protein H0A64_07195 [Alcaligenaceae bacterium]|nr:hypothetical protein [Alcaligenaceae bacterium]